MEPKLWMYLMYLLLSVGLTAWVARTLFRNGAVFLEDALGNERLSHSVNHLLVVGFYLLNLGYAAVAIRVSNNIVDAAAAVETLSVKIGLVLLVLGAVHFFNLYVLSRFRRRRMLDNAPPPVQPSYRLAMPHPGAAPAGYPAPMHPAPMHPAPGQSPPAQSPPDQSAPDRPARPDQPPR
jgi:hypothetical protein